MKEKCDYCKKDLEDNEVETYFGSDTCCLACKENMEEMDEDWLEEMDCDGE